MVPFRHNRRATSTLASSSGSPTRVAGPGFCRLLVNDIRGEESRRGLTTRRAFLSLSAIALFGVLLLPSTGSSRSFANVSRSLPVRPSLDHMAREVVYLVNLERAQRKLPPLRVNTRLVVDARLQAAQIATTGLLDHVILGGPYPTPRIRAEAAGYAWNVLGENLALGYPDAQSAVAAWMRSPGHRANILGDSYSETGVVLAPDARGRLIFVQTFGAPE